MLVAERNRVIGIMLRGRIVNEEPFALLSCWQNDGAFSKCLGYERLVNC
jgi:hypothetical protein